MRTASAVAVLFFLFSGLAEPTNPSDIALTQGNRLFEKDDVEGALEAYERGWREDGSRADGVLAGVLAYNAGTCALRLGRLPEALLWYRRAERAIPGDPWLRDNLAHTRQALGDPPVEIPIRERWLPGRFPFTILGVALSWAALLLILLVRHPPRGLLAFAALLACGCFVAGMFPETFPESSSPSAAVLLAPCPAKDGLPAGSEVRVLPLDGGGWRIVGKKGGPQCPPETVGLVAP